jgi:hypothetical protein
MTIYQAFKHLLNNWKPQDKEFKDKYRSYRSKHLSKKEPIGVGKKIEMLEKAGYVIIVKAP